MTRLSQSDWKKKGQWDITLPCSQVKAASEGGKRGRQARQLAKTYIDYLWILGETFKIQGGEKIVGF